MSEIVVQLRTPCGGKHGSLPGFIAQSDFGCQLAGCPGFTYTEVDFVTALRAVLRENPDILRDVFADIGRELAKPREIL